jgi:hypothetical protein
METTDLSVVGDAQLEAQLTATAQEIGLRTARKKKLENARALAEARAIDLAAATEAAASRSPQPPPETRPTTKVGASPGGDGAKATAQANEPEPKIYFSDGRGRLFMGTATCPATCPKLYVKLLSDSQLFFMGTASCRDMSQTVCKTAQ